METYKKEGKMKSIILKIEWDNTNKDELHPLSVQLALQAYFYVEGVPFVNFKVTEARKRFSRIRINKDWAIIITCFLLMLIVQFIDLIKKGG